jgi:predicted alpha/beta-hydrolase family hydrolase
MALERVWIPFAEETLSGILSVPERPSGVGVVLGHGAGNDMTAALLASVAEGLAARGRAVLRFNFSYTERKRKAPDPMPKLERAFVAAIDAARARPSLFARLVLGGKSMGGRVASHLAADGHDAAGLVFLGYPLHTADPAKGLRDAHLPRIEAPMLFVQGSRDRLCDLARLRPVLERLESARRAAGKPPSATLYVVEGGDHSLDVPKSSGRTRADVQAEVVGVIDAWLERLGANPSGSTRAPRR